MRKYFYFLSTVLTAGIISFAGVNGTMEITDKNGKAGYTGSPGEQNCTSCHSGTINSGSGSIAIATSIPPAGYTPGQTYQIDVTVTDATSSLFGFGFEALLTSGNVNAGTFTITNPASTQIKTASVSGNVRNNVVHTLNGGASAGQKVFSFNWTAPAAGSGDVTFYAVGNAANGNNANSGDKIYSTNSTIGEFNSSSVEMPTSSISAVNIYPNPVSESLNVRFFLMAETEVSIQLLDLNGKLIANFANFNANGEVNQLYLMPSNLSKGIYFLNITTNREKIVEKIFVQ
jgi:hypothetical protein